MVVYIDCVNSRLIEHILFIYNVSNEQFHEGFRQHFKPCLKALCPGAKCKEEEGTTNTKETDYVSLVYGPKGRMSDANENNCQMSILTNNCKGFEAVHLNGGCVSL